MASNVEMMNAIIKHQIAIIGTSVAVRQARKVQGIAVGENGLVTAGASREKLGQLVDAYRGLAGPVAVRFAKNAISTILTGQEDLPDNLKWFEISDGRKFACCHTTTIRDFSLLFCRIRKFFVRADHFSYRKLTIFTRASFPCSHETCSCNQMRPFRLRQQ
jgi:hypothetical protein